jgi:tol-pal system protein YbgF
VKVGGDGETSDPSGAQERAAVEGRPEDKREDERPQDKGRPALTIVKLGPDGSESVVERVPSESDSDEEEPEPRLRPVLRVHGSEEGDVAHVIAADSEPPAQTAVLVADDESTGSGANRTPSDAEKKKMRAVAAAAAEYETALSAVRQKNYAKAEPGLRRFVERHPDHPYSDNALYWLGECLFQRGDYAGARDSFAKVEARYPGENKVPDALLKLALSYERLGQTDEAKKTIGRLQAAHPDTAAARRIPESYSSK